MTTAAGHYDRLLAQHYTWMLGGDISALATDQARLLENLGVRPTVGTTAVDLGCGPGPQALALAALGFTPVVAVDTSRTLLGELAAHSHGNSAIQPVHADIRTVLPQISTPGSVAAIVCMGDTLTHLPSRSDVTSMLGDIAQALAEGGRLVITYRDLSQPLRGTDRFIPVRSTADQLLSCFLEYQDDDTVVVHDLLFTRSGDAWTQQIGSYPKLRISADWLAAQCREAGLTVQQNGNGPRGMQLLSVTKPAATQQV